MIVKMQNYFYFSNFATFKYNFLQKMKILIIGGNGTIGTKVTAHFAQSHEVLVASRSNSTLPIDIRNSESITALLERIAPLDAIVNISGEAKWAKFQDLSEEDYYIGIRSKLMGQVNLVRIGKDYLNPTGSITLSTGILADDPVFQTASAALVNGGIHSFVQAAALELKAGIRLNAVSLGLVEDAYEKYKDYFLGHNPIPTPKVINAYVKAVQGGMNGKVIRVYN